MRKLLLTTAVALFLPGAAHAGPVFAFVGGFLASVGAAGVGAAITAAGAWLTGTFLGQLVLSVGLSALAQAFAPGPPKLRVPSPSERMVNYAQPVSYMERGYGRVKKGGAICFTGYSKADVTTPGGTDDRNKRHYGVLIAAHSTEGPVEYYLDALMVEIDGDGFVTTPPLYRDDDIRREARRWVCKIRPYTGQAGQTTDALWADVFPEITADHNFAGLSYVALYAAAVADDHFARTYPQGREWALSCVWDMSDDVYDPRDESTGWTDNAALIIAAEALQFGKTVDSDEVADQADICDQIVSNADGGTQKRWTINGIFDDSQSWETVRSQLATACDAWFYERLDGKLGFKVGAWEEPTVTLTEADFLQVQVTDSAWGPDAPGQFVLRYVEPARQYIETPAGAWVEDEAGPQSEGECWLINSHNQAARIEKRIGKLARAQYNITGTLKMIGYDLIGQRFVRVQLATLDLDVVVEVQRLIRNAGGVTFSFESKSVEEADFDFDADTEEPERPQYGEVESANDVPEPTGLSGEVIEDTGGAALIEWTWDGVDDVYSQDLRMRSVDAGLDWQVYRQANDQWSMTASGLVDGATYEAQVRNRSASGRLSDWKPDTPVAIVAVANTVAPGDLSGVAVAAVGSDAEAEWTAPNSGTYAAARIRRGTTTVYADATVVRVEYGAPNLADSWTDSTPGTGTWYYWLEPINSSGIAGTVSGPHTVTIP
jgi:hypothetical protein